MTRLGQFTIATEQSLEAIRRLNPVINSMVHVSPDTALQQAAEADAAAQNGEWTGLLEGIPLTLKDCIDVAGMPTTYGSGSFRSGAANADAEAVRYLRRAGSIILGKANLSEFCFGVTNENVHLGDCRNPWNVDCIPGGSSGGSAASVAAGMCRISIGSDTGGSVRIPAALCGLAGLRPTKDRVSNVGTYGISDELDTLGPLAYSVSDVARAFAVLAGSGKTASYHPARPLENFLPTLRDGIESVRIGVPRNFYFDDLQPDVEERVREACRVLEQCGAKLVDITVPGAEEAQQHVGKTIALADVADLHRERIESRPDTIGSDVLRRMRLGLAITGRDYARSLRWLENWKSQPQVLFADVDLLVTPTTPSVAPARSGELDMIEATNKLSRFTYGFSGAGLPGLSVPCGFSAGGLPVGMLLTGAWFRDPLLLRAGVAYQSRTEFHHARPSVST